MVMTHINKAFFEKYGNDYTVINKRLATAEEIEKLKKNFENSSIAWLDKWWIPINW